MSFLNPVRLAFAGTFQADVSTVNNDVRHYDNATFEPVYQELQHGHELNGWFNPSGSGAFRLIDCRVTRVWYADGTSTADPADDPVVGMWVGGSSGRTSGKLVDIDPQWQLASAPFGLAMRLTDGRWNVVGGKYRAAAFRDLWFSRLTVESNDGAASSTFQSVLEDVTWADDAKERSRFADELIGATAPGRLSVRLATFGYNGNATNPRFTLGTVVGTIGPQLPGEPESFVAGRRFTPASGFSSWAGITYCIGLCHNADGVSTLLLDLSNALQITAGTGTPADIGTLTAGILRDAAVTENTPVTVDSFEPVAEVRYREGNWLQSTGGVFAAPMTSEQAALAADHPLALITTDAPFNPGDRDFGNALVAIRESAEGRYVCAEPAVHRLDPGKQSSFTVHALRYGVPMADQQVQVSQVGRVPDQGGGPGTDPHPPPAPIPDIGVPEDALEVSAAGSTTNADGVVEVTLRTTSSGPGNPRKYLDGQIYLIDYRLPGQSDSARQPFDYVVVHARDAAEDKENPTWEDVEPILTQYANLYPVMSKGLFNLGDREAVLRHRDLLLLSFSADMDDPNHMPVTRDLSEVKRKLLLRWLRTASAKEEPAAALRAAVPASPAAPVEGPHPAAPPPGGSRERPQPREPEVGEADSKKRFAAGFQQALHGRRRA